MSPFDIIARLERNPTGWVCIRREAADEIRKLRAENAALEAKLAIAVEALEDVSCYVADGASLSEYRDFQAALAKIKELAK